MPRARHALPVGDDGVEMDERLSVDEAERSRRGSDLDLACDLRSVVILPFEVVVAELDVLRGADPVEPPSGDTVARGNLRERGVDLVAHLEPDENPGAFVSRLHF